LGDTLFWGASLAGSCIGFPEVEGVDVVSALFWALGAWAKAGLRTAATNSIIASLFMVILLWDPARPGHQNERAGLEPVFKHCNI
jgi:hypothetical protein